MLLTFKYWLSFGKGDSGEAYIEMEVTEEECERLKEAHEEYEDFFGCKSVEDIYDRAYDIANEQATNDLVFEGILDKGKKASELYPIEVCFPEE